MNEGYPEAIQDSLAHTVRDLQVRVGTVAAKLGLGMDTQIYTDPNSVQIALEISICRLHEIYDNLVRIEVAIDHLVDTVGYKRRVS